ncbi:ANTAR domain-containing protein [Streptomyces paromomycinus]|uniref:ANTAR domain-containing protein n=1 Tax=Streptomyces paromomycinus TaxID=92743 RepID=A0A401VV60_STREY|nr:ANTAR domain-containing protein [Streptomyces paromomycinus]GCD40967.1 ANTAR domain-containing protein [Streptomyces paromomycinus]
MPEAAHWARLPDDPAAGNGNGGPPAAYAPSLARTGTSRNGDRTAVSVHGELDLNACGTIESGLHEAVNRSSRGVDLHLGSVTFCDCSGLNMLLRLRQRAGAQGKSVVIVSSSRAVERLLELTEARELFVPPEPDPDPAPDPNPAPGPAFVPAPHSDHGAHHAPNGAPDSAPRHAPDGGRPAFSAIDDPARYEDASRDLPTEIAQLRRAMRTRPAIDLARGILMATFTLSPEAAWSVLVSASQNTNMKLHVLAQELVDSVQGAALPEAVQGQLGAAVARARAAPAVPAQSGTAAVRNTGPEPWRAAPGE